MKGRSEEKHTVKASSNQSVIKKPPLKPDQKQLQKRQKEQEREGIYLPQKKDKLLPDINVLGDTVGEGDIVRVKSGVDRILLVLVLILISFGSVMVFSASYADASARFDDSYHFIKRQIIFVAIGFLFMFIVMRLPYTIFKFVTVPSYIATLGLLGVVLIMGVVGGGAQRWIAIGSFTFQPSELAKLTLVMMLAWYYTTFQEGMRYKKWSMLSRHPEKRKEERKLWWKANFTYGILFIGENK